MKNITLSLLIVLTSFIYGNANENNYKEILGIYQKIYEKKDYQNLIDNKLFNWRKSIEKKCLTYSNKDECIDKEFVKKNKELISDLKNLIQLRVNNMFIEPQKLVRLSLLLPDDYGLSAYSVYALTEGLLGKVDDMILDANFNDLFNNLIKYAEKEKAKQKDEIKSEYGSKYDKFVYSIYRMENDNTIKPEVIKRLKEEYDNREKNNISRRDIITQLIYYLHYSDTTVIKCIPSYSFEKEWGGNPFIETYGGYSSTFIINKMCSLPKNKDIQEIESFVDFSNVLQDIYGRPGIHICTGSMEYFRLASNQFTLRELSFITFEKYKKLKKSTNLESFDIVNKYLKLWSSKGIWNYKVYNEYLKTKKNFLNDLKKHYKQRLNLNYLDAEDLAKFVTNSILTSRIYINKKNLAPMKKEVFRIFSEDLTLENVKEINIDNQKDLDLSLKYALLSQKNEPVIEYLLKKGAQINVGLESALFYALNDDKNTELLLKRGANVNYENTFKKTPIFSAIQLNNLETIKVLINYGANINQKTTSIMGLDNESKDDSCYNIDIGGRTPLIYVLWQGNIETIEYLIKYSKNINIDVAKKYINKNILLNENTKKYILENFFKD